MLSLDWIEQFYSGELNLAIKSGLGNVRLWHKADPQQQQCLITSHYA